MEKKRSVGLSVISAMGALAAFVGIIGMPLRFSAFSEIINTFYACGHWRSYISINDILQVLLIATIFILPHIIYAISSITIFFLKRWARKIIFFIAPISTLSTFLIAIATSITPAPTSGSMHLVSKLYTVAYLGVLYAIISNIIIIFYLTRPKVKEQFR